MELGKTVRMGHPGLVGLPLFLTMVFCFALVMAHPHNQVTDARSASAEKVSNESNASLKAKPKEETLFRESWRIIFNGQGDRTDADPVKY